MKNIRLISAFSAIAFAVAVPFTFVACGDDTSSANNDDAPISSSENEETLSSSSATEASEIECNAENEGEVKVQWEGNPKYGGNEYYRCEGGSWVKGDITLTCDTAGVQVGDTCVTHPSINIFQAGMNPQAGELLFVYKGEGVWERSNQAQIDSLIERQNRRDAAIQEFCGEPDPEKENQCCYTIPDEFAADYADDVASILYEYDNDVWSLREYFGNSNCVRDAEEEVIEE